MKKVLLIAMILFAFVMQNSMAQSVGINSDGSTPNASAMLDVKSTNKGFLPPRIALTGTTDVTTISSPVAGLLIYNTSNTNDVTPGYYYYGGSSWVKVDAGLWSFDLEEDISTNYNVGIGTTTPQNKLVVGGSGWAQFISNTHGSNPSTDYNYGVYIGSNRSGGATEGNIAYHDYLTFAEWDGTTYSERMRIDGNGNVGIGTATPTNTLHIYSSDNEPFYIQTSGDGAWMNIQSSTSHNWSIGATPGWFGIYDRTAETYRTVITDDGKVGIGLTNPNARLHIGGFGYGVLGGITMTPDNDTEGGHYMTFTNAARTADVGYIARGSGNTVVYSTSSDYRLKENVVNLDIDQAKSRLMSLRPVEYNYISDENKTVISGFLAHEMADAGFANGVTGEKDAVDKDGKPIYQAIDTKFLIPEMVKVIQEQQTEIDALKKELEEIKKVLEYKK